MAFINSVLSADNSGQHSCFLSTRSWIQVYVPKPTVLTQVHRGFPPSIQTTAGTEIQIWTFLIHYSIIILSVRAIQNTRTCFVRKIAYITFRRACGWSVD